MADQYHMPFTMSQTVKYRLSITPEPYESALTPKDISMEEIKASATMEENYVEAIDEPPGSVCSEFADFPC